MTFARRLTHDATRDVPETPIPTTNILDVVDELRDDLVAFIRDLVQIPSLPGEEAPAHAIVASKLESLGLEVRMVSSTREQLARHPAFCDDGIPVERRVNVVGCWRGRHGRGRPESRPARSLILNGHLDVVSPGNEALWDESPWSASIRDGRLYGRGACDMKAGLSAAVFAIEALQRSGVLLGEDVLLQSVSGEESGGVGTLTTIVNGYHADAAIILEPTSLRLCLVQAGALTFRLRVDGRSIHACLKPEGVSAIDKVYHLLEAIDALERERHLSHRNPLYVDPMNIAPISVGTIHGGEWHSTVPGEVVVEGRCGVLPGEPVERARGALADALHRASAADPWLHDHPPTLEWFEGQFESGSTDLDAPIVALLGECHRAITGQPATPQGVTYGSDLRLFTNHAKIPAILYGPGDIAQAHAVNEFVELDQVVEATKVLALTMYRWCGGDVAR